MSSPQMMRMLGLRCSCACAGLADGPRATPSIVATAAVAGKDARFMSSPQHGEAPPPRSTGSASGNEQVDRVPSLLQILLHLLPERLLGRLLAVVDERADRLAELVEGDRADRCLALRLGVAVDPVRDPVLVVRVEGEE